MWHLGEGPKTKQGHLAHLIGSGTLRRVPQPELMTKEERARKLERMQEMGSKAKGLKVQNPCTKQVFASNGSSQARYAR
eukprot:m.277581 g.277581  ORF g.277581 m.277581 type:complete len:79 (-) comp15729_c0_seq3:158-394(-)